MPAITFKVSDNQKYNYLWSLLNPNFCEEGNWTVECGICEVYDEYAVVMNYVDGQYERVYYTKDDSTDSVSISKRERCFILDVSEGEKKALDALRALNGDSYELVDEKFSTIPTLENSVTELNAKISENDTKIEELNTTIATLTTERDEAISAGETAKTEATATYNALKADYDAVVAEKATLTTEKEELVAYKKNIEDTAKLAIIDSYSDSLDEETLNKFRTNLDAYSAEDLDMRLTYAAKKAHPEVFAKQPTPAYVPKDNNDDKSGLESILSKYEKKH